MATATGLDVGCSGGSTGGGWTGGSTRDVRVALFVFAITTSICVSVDGSGALLSSSAIAGSRSAAALGVGIKSLYVHALQAVVPSGAIFSCLV